MLFSRSQQLRLAGLVCAFALAGCGGGGHGRNSGTGYARFSWVAYDVLGDQYQTCSGAGASSVVITLTDTVNPSYQYVSDVYNCDGWVGDSAPVPAGSYYVRFDVYGSQNVYNNTTTLLDSFDIVDPSGSTAVFHIVAGLNDFTLNHDPASIILRSFLVGWTFASGPASPGLCASLGIANVELAFTTAAGQTAVSTLFPCQDGKGYSFPYPFPNPNGPSTATWRLYLIDNTGADVTYIEGGTVNLPSLQSDPADVSLGTWSFSY